MLPETILNKKTVGRLVGYCRQYKYYEWMSRRHLCEEYKIEYLGKTWAVGDMNVCGRSLID